MEEHLNSDQPLSYIGAIPALKIFKGETSHYDAAQATATTGIEISPPVGLAQNWMSLAAATPSRVPHASVSADDTIILSNEKRKRQGERIQSDATVSERKRSRLNQNDGDMPAASKRKQSQSSSSSNLKQQEISKHPRDQGKERDAQTELDGYEVIRISRKPRASAGPVLSTSSPTTSGAWVADPVASGRTTLEVSPQRPPAVNIHQPEERTRLGNNTAEQPDIKETSTFVDRYVEEDVACSAVDKTLHHCGTTATGQVPDTRPMEAQISMRRWSTRKNIRQQSSPLGYGHRQYNDMREQSSPATIDVLCSRCAVMVSVENFPPSDIIATPSEVCGGEDLLLTFKSLQIEDGGKQNQTAGEVAKHLEKRAHSDAVNVCFQCGGSIGNQPGCVQPARDFAKERANVDDAAQRQKLEWFVSWPTRKRKWSEMEGQWEEGSRDLSRWLAEVSRDRNNMPVSFSQDCKKPAIPQTELNASCISDRPSDILSSAAQRGISGSLRMNSLFLTRDSAAFENQPLISSACLKNVASKGERLTSKAMEHPTVTFNVFAEGKENRPYPSPMFSVAPRSKSSTQCWSDEIHERSGPRQSSGSGDVPSTSSGGISAWNSPSPSSDSSSRMHMASRMGTSPRSLDTSSVGRFSSGCERIDHCAPKEKPSASTEEFMRSLELYVQEQERDPILWQYRVRHETDSDEEEPGSEGQDSRKF